ncbi:MAG: DUF2726 domain-containing protein [Thiotrichales bacterium]|nr:DUF2726 domain-containing protein [Thiotrichales bacterium]
MYQLLCELSGKDHPVLVNQDLNSLVTPAVNQWERHSGWQQMHQHISGHKVSFVICDTVWQPICGLIFIDIDKNEQVDSVVVQALKCAGLPLLTLYSYQHYTAEALASEIAQQIQALSS